MSTTRHTETHSPFDVVVVVGSHGARDAFRPILATLPANFPSAVVFDLHRSEDNGVLEEILRRRGSLHVTAAREGMQLAGGTLFVAPHDRQLVTTAEGRLALLGAGDGFGHRFADELLVSAAAAFGARVIAIVLSGRLDGGARGVRAVKREGGRVLVQDPRTAAAAGMPTAALATGCVDFVLSPSSLGEALLVLCAVPGAAELFRVRLNPTIAG